MNNETKRERCPHCGCDAVTLNTRFCPDCSVYLTPFTAAALVAMNAR